MDLVELAESMSRTPDGVPRDVALLFEKLALEVAQSGLRRFSADAILHRIRWFHQVEQRKADFKINNNYSADLARWFMARHPNLKGFFETRQTRGEAA